MRGRIIFIVKMISIKKFYEKHASKRCKYCLKDLKYEESSMDHIIPISKRGPSHQINLVLACVMCNASKRNLTLKKWYLECDTEFRKTKDDYYKTIMNSITIILSSKLYKSIRLKRKKKALGG